MLGLLQVISSQLTLLKRKRINEISLLKVVLIRGIQRDLVVNWISFTLLYM